MQGSVSSECVGNIRVGATSQQNVNNLVLAQESWVGKQSEAVLHNSIKFGLVLLDVASNGLNLVELNLLLQGFIAYVLKILGYASNFLVVDFSELMEQRQHFDDAKDLQNLYHCESPSLLAFQLRVSEF